MEELQKKIFDASEKLLARVIPSKVIINTLVSTIVVMVVLYFMEVPFNVILVLVIILASFGFAFFRDFFEARRARKYLLNFYESLKQGKPGVDLFIPLLIKDKGVYYRKQSCLYFYQDRLYLEAFGPSRNQQPKESLNVKYGKDFEIKKYELDEDELIYNFEAKLMDGETKFSIVNIEEVINLIEKVKGEN